MTWRFASALADPGTDLRDVCVLFLAEALPVARILPVVQFINPCSSRVIQWVPLSDFCAAVEMDI